MSSDLNHALEEPQPEVCPACGGAGGGPFGRANSAWDVETYVCPRCEGLGFLRQGAPAADDDAPPLDRPGIAKTVPPDPVKKRRAKAG